MKLRIIFLALLLLLALNLSGCWDYEEYEELIQVTAFGFDYDKKSGQATQTVQYVPTSKPSSGNQSSGSQSPNQEIVHSATDRTLFEAVAKAQQVIFKKLFLGYIRVLVIGEGAAKYNMLDFIELLDRSPAIRKTTNIVITTGKAEDAFEEMLVIPGLEATAPRVITVSKKPKPEAAGGTKDNIRFDEGRPGDLRVAGMGAFKGATFKGWLNEQESRGFGWITGKNIRSYKVSETSERANSKDMFFYRLSQSKGKIKVQINKNKPVFQVNVKVVADLRKYYSHKGSDFLTPQEVSLMEKKLSESIRSDIEAALRRGQKELKTDIFGYGFALFRENPKLWRTNYEREWQNIFPRVPIHVNVAAKIINTGTNIRKFEIR